MKKLAFSVFAAALAFGAEAVERVETTAAETESCSGYDGFYLGVGVAVVNDGYVVEDRFSSEIEKGSDYKTKLAASLALGFGGRIKEKAYLGLETGLDASQNSEYDDGNIRIGGLLPSVALKIGFIHPETRSMGYLKAGAAYSRTKRIDDDTSAVFHSCRWSPIVALGAEKLFGKNVRTRFEAEYRFRTNKTFNDVVNEDKKVESFKLTNRGAVTLRAMAIYTIKK